LDFKNWKSFIFRFFVGDVISKVGSGIFGPGYQALSPNNKKRLF